jgi:hypothetical protein
MAIIRFISGRAALADFINNDIAGEIRDRLSASKYNASGGLSKSLRTEVSDSGSATVASLSGYNYWQWVGNGRGPGKMPPVAPLVKWALDKGLAKTEKEASSIGYLIARGIAREGSLDFQLGGKNVVREVVREAQPKLERVVRVFLRDIEKPLADRFEQAFAS